MCIFDDRTVFGYYECKEKYTFEVTEAVHVIFKLLGTLTKSCLLSFVYDRLNLKTFVFLRFLNLLTITQFSFLQRFIMLNNILSKKNSSQYTSKLKYLKAVKRPTVFWNRKYLLLTNYQNTGTS